MSRSAFLSIILVMFLIVSLFGNALLVWERTVMQALSKELLAYKDSCQKKHAGQRSNQLSLLRRARMQYLHNATLTRNIPEHLFPYWIALVIQSEVLSDPHESIVRIPSQTILGVQNESFTAVVALESGSALQPVFRLYAHTCTDKSVRLDYTGTKSDGTMHVFVTRVWVEVSDQDRFLRVHDKLQTCGLFEFVEDGR